MKLTSSEELKPFTNQSNTFLFIFVGLTDDPSLQLVLFYAFLIMYIMTVAGNIGIFVIIYSSPHLHTPMYFFLSHLSFIDFCYASSVAPNTIMQLVKEEKYISLVGCATQLFTFSSFGSTECLLFGVMAYDRFVAICTPLRYGSIMTKQACNKLIVAAYVTAVLQAAIQTGSTFSLHFCGSNILDHFFCDVNPLLRASCSDTLLNEILVLVCAAMIGGGSLLVILTSYTYIVLAVIKIPSLQGKKKAFSTCASHLMCVTLFYGAVLSNYLHLSSTTFNQEMVSSIFYTVVIPTVNPIIYSLRNKEVKIILMRLLNQRF
ncbi:olfactory receptor 5A1-like [Bombina bombina]|uniref:olfactory receptor 5A1-like n=1 Tax=Bombina bombina TaxID=8345 RepID=UPI00235B084D|nr:olfactory receptor 5A1-like [Bombina bombina]